jgi:hypothetical protein
VKTPLDSNNRLSKLDGPEVVIQMYTGGIAVLSDAFRTW